MRRRTLLSVVAVALAATAAMVSPSAPARAQSAWPERTVKIIVPFGPGGSTDLIARPWAEKLSQAFGQQFVIENRGGAGGIIGTEAASKAAPDGYTLLVTGNSALTVQPHLRATPYDPVGGFAAVARVGDLVCGFTVNASTGIGTFQELLAYARKNPGKLVYGSSGLGTTNQLRYETMRFKTGVDILHIPYRGSAEALNDLLAGNVQLMNEINVLPHVATGKLKLLAVNYSSRHPDFPDVPTLTEAGLVDADVPIFFLLMAPAGSPDPIVRKLNEKIAEIARSPDMIARMRAISVVVPIETPDEMRRTLAEDSRRNAEMIRIANIKAE